MFTDNPSSTHPDTEAIAAYLSAGLSPAERADLEAHLTRCRACRNEVTSARELLPHRRAGRQWRLIVPAAAAAAVVLVLVGSLRNRGLRESERLREGRTLTPDLAPAITPVAPAADESVARDRLAFVWRRQANDPLYRFTVTDVSGRVVWVAETSDTALALPAGVSLGGGREYLWYVDALGSDGQSVTTGIRRFRASR